MQISLLGSWGLGLDPGFFFSFGRFTIIPNMGAQIIKIPYIKWTLETHPKPIYNITKKLLTSYKLQNCHQFLKTSPTPKSHKNTQSTQ